MIEQQPTSRYSSHTRCWFDTELDADYDDDYDIIILKTLSWKCSQNEIESHQWTHVCSK